MKILTPLENLFTVPALLLINVIGILLTEFVGNGTFFAETGLVHGVAVLFIVLIIVSIFTDYVYSDRILKGFLKIQFALTLLLGFAHVYEYFGTNVFILRDDVVELSMMATYLIWLIGTTLSFEFLFKIYYKKSYLFTVILSLVILAGLGILVFANLSNNFADMLSPWLPKMVLGSTVVFAGLNAFYMRKIVGIMPIFKETAKCAIPAMALVLLATFSEYFESTGALKDFGISATQNLYISHFLIYGALSLLLIAFSKLKKPAGIYAEM